MLSTDEMTKGSGADVDSPAPGIAWSVPTLPGPRRLRAWDQPPTVEWVEGSFDRFSTAAGPAYGIVERDGERVVTPIYDLPLCANCRMAKPSLMKCSRCQRVKYCDRACQKAHWPTHKQDCCPSGTGALHEAR